MIKQIIIISIIILYASLNTYGDNKHLIIRGKVNKVEKKEKMKGYVDLEVNLSLHFENQDSEPIILLKPINKYIYWYGSFVVARSEESAMANQYIYRMGFWPSAYDFPEYKELAINLDQAYPPEQYTILIRPGESWEWNTSAFLRFSENESSGILTNNLSWQEIKQLKQTLWIRTSYEIWPKNLERAKMNIGKDLQKRWLQIGTLWNGDKEHSGRVSTEPIEIDLSCIEN